MLDNYDQLAIRACKQLHGTKLINRLRRILARRNAYDVDYISVDFWLFDWLQRVRTKIQTPIRWDDVVRAGSPNEGWKYGTASQDGENGKYWERLILVMASDIRHSEVKDIPQYHSPLRFRNPDLVFPLDKS